MYVVTTHFIGAALANAATYDMPVIRTVQLPDPEWQPLVSASSGEQMTDMVLGAIDGIVEALTSPLTPEEASPTASSEEMDRIISVTGEDYADAAEKVNQLFMERLWSDGMSIVPPTEAAVQRMLAGTSRSPDEVIGEIKPEGGKATIEKIAINAVMGGAKPEYLPLIIAAMEVLADENFDTVHLQCSAGGSVAPVVMVSGPIGKELDINSGLGMFGFGWRANATIGRSVRLSLINLGHVWPGINRMASIGQPGEYTSWTIAEQPNIPFDPLHVDFGFEPTDSVVSVFGVEWRAALRGGSISAGQVESGLEGTARAMEEQFASYHFASYAQSYYLIVMGPTAAEALAEEGYSKEDVRNWLYEHALVPYSSFAEKDRMKLKENIANGRIPELWNTENENALLPVVIDPAYIWIVIAGPRNDTLVFQAVRHQLGSSLIQGATLTEAGQ